MNNGWRARNTCFERYLFRMRDDLGDRMKLFEQAEAGRSLMPTLPVLARLDGRGFHNFTRYAQRPFSRDFHRLMVATTRYLVEESAALTGYTQSDEIALLWHSRTVESQIFFDGRIQKMVSTLAAMASAYFNLLTRSQEQDEEGGVPGPEFAAMANRAGLAWQRLPTFDCRVWCVPTREEASNVFVWRQKDARRNSVQMAARAQFSHAQCDGKSSNELQEMLHAERGINWDDYEPAFKRGTFIQRYRAVRRYTGDEIARLPEKHAARENPDLEVERSLLREADLWLTRISNREAVLFEGEDPEPWAEP